MSTNANEFADKLQAIEGSLLDEILKTGSQPAPTKFRAETNIEVPLLVSLVEDGDELGFYVGINSCHYIQKAHAPALYKLLGQYLESVKG